MGIFIAKLLRDAAPSSLEKSDIYLLEELGFKSDDNTGLTKVAGKIRKNIVGEHAYPSIRKLAKKGIYSRSSLNRSITRLRNKHWIEPMGKSENGTYIYRINLFKAFCYLDLYTIVEKEDLEDNHPDIISLANIIENATIEQIPETGILNIQTIMQGHYIDNWRELMENDEIIQYWITCRDENGKVTTQKEETSTISAGRKESKGEVNLSTNDNSIIGDNYAKPENIPLVKLPHKVTFTTENGNKETLVFNAEHINENGELDVFMLDVPHDVKQEFDKSSNVEKFSLQNFNSKHKESLAKIRKEYLENSL